MAALAVDASAVDASTVDASAMDASTVDASGNKVVYGVGAGEETRRKTKKVGRKSTELTSIVKHPRSV